MKKKIALLCAMVIFVMSIAQSVGAINVIMNSSFVNFPDQEPVIQNGVTLVPIRSIAEALGLEVTWDDPSDTVVLKKDNFYIELVIGSTKAKTSSGTKTLLQAPCIINSRTMVPLRFIAEEMGLTVLWNDEYQRVVINGKVDTETITLPPVEDTTDVIDEAASDVEFTEPSSDAVEYFEEETEFVEEGEFISIDSSSLSIMFELPVSFYPEETDLEESFAYRSLDAFDAQHTYNWEIVSRYESYADETSANGILFVVQELEPYEGEEYDISNMNQEYPEAPERPQWPEVDFNLMQEEMQRVMREQLFIDLGVEIPDNVMELSNEQLVEALGLESEEALTDQVQISMENADLSQVPGYDEYVAWQEENEVYRDEKRAYDEEVAQISAVKNYAIRNFSSLADKADDDSWANLFSTYLNTDGEVRYDGVEILNMEGKKVIHATIYAEDPDDEQGVYEYYHFIDGNTVITIFGGTLFGSEASIDAVNALSNMTIH